MTVFYAIVKFDVEPIDGEDLAEVAYDELSSAEVLYASREAIVANKLILEDGIVSLQQVVGLTIPREVVEATIKAKGYAL